MMGDLDVDIEELECRLYSQVYHSGVEEYEDQNAISNMLQSSNTLRHQNVRYFRSQTLTKPHPNNLNFIPINHNPQHSLTNPKLQAADFFNGISNVNPIPPILNDPIPPMVHMVNPYNNVVVLPQFPTKVISKEKYLRPRNVNANLAHYFDRQTKRERKKEKWAERQKQKRREKRRRDKELKNANSKNSDEFKVHYLNQTNVSSIDENQQDEVVTISDSDSEDSCIEIPQKRVLVVLTDSDNENKEESTLAKIEPNLIEQNEIKSEFSKIDVNPPENVENLEDDDILVVDDLPIEVEIIDIDCDDSKSVTNIGDNTKVSSEKSLETNSTNSFMKKPASLPRTTITAKERNELLRTPDSTSTSNDFLDNSIDLQQNRFNFALHGSDFDSTEIFVKPKSNIYEAESSCSASESGTPSRSNVFHEVEFETPQKDLFDEDGLGAFSDYITPNRDNLFDKPSTSNIFQQVLTKVNHSKRKIHAQYSDTSSESDYDTIEKPCNIRAKKNLPNLTVVEADNPRNHDKSPEANRDSCDNVSNKRKKNNISDITITPNQTQLKDDLPPEEPSTNIIEVDDTLTMEKDYQSPEEDEDVLILNASKSMDVFSISDDEMCGDPQIETDIQLSNFKSNEEPPRKIREPDKVTGFSKYWTSDMCKFYNTSWGLENFSVEDTQRAMSDDKKLWRVEEDRYHYRNNTHRGPRCHTCREFGHMAMHCPNGSRPTVCTLCGQGGHSEPRCPNATCTLCGATGGYGTYCSNCARWSYIRCRICKMYGHIDQKCPDLWRRYHLTTEPGPIVKPSKTVYKSPEDRWCSGCARSGHYEYKCNFYTRSHNSVDPNIHEYYDVHNYPKEKPFIVQSDYTSSPSIPLPARVPEQNRNDRIIEISETNNNSKPSTSETQSTDMQQSNNENLEIIDVVGFDMEPAKTNECNIQVTFDNSIFPPIEMIPPYFRKQLQAERNEHSIVNSDTMPAIWKDQRFVRNPVAANFQSPHNISASNISHSKHATEIDLNCKQLGLVRSQAGVNFIERIRSNMGVSVDIIPIDVGPYPDGIVTIGGHPRDVRYIHRELKKFISVIPSVMNIPLQSKAAYNFLSSKMEKVDKVVGNCKSLYKSLVKLEMQQKYGGNRNELRTRIKSTKIHLNMLLFGKLLLGDGEKHMYNLDRWRREFEEEEDHPIPFHIMFDIMEAYSYIFLDTVNHEYKRFCNVQSNTKRNLNTTSNKDLKSTGHYFKLVESKCRKFGLIDKLNELQRLNLILHNSNFSVKAFKEYMTFCHKVLRLVKVQGL